MSQFVNRQTVTLGGLPLMVDGDDYESTDGYKLRVVGEDADLGNAAAVTQVLLSMLTDGSLIDHDRDDNREPTFIVEVEAAYDDGLALARGEAALRAVCKRPAELVWLPPQAGALAAVFDVVFSTFDLEYTDADEMVMVRAFRIGMSALPYARSVEPTVFTAEPVPPSGGTPALTTINNADTTAGWSSVTDTISDVGTAIRATGNPADTGAAFLKTVAILTVPAGTFTGLPYVVFEWRLGSASTLTPRTSNAFGAVPLKPIIKITQTGGWTQAWYKIEPQAGVWTLADLTTLVIDQDVSPYPVPATSWFEVRDVSAASAPATVGSIRQLVRTLTIGGTETTQGSIDVVHPTTDLGDVIVYVRPVDDFDYVPAISRYATGGAATPANVSGLEFTDDNITFTIPASALPPGDYHVVARVNHNGAASPHQYTITTESRLGGVAVATGPTSVQQVPAPNSGYVVRSLGMVTLPPSRLGPSGEVVIDISHTGAGFVTNIKWDEVWLFHEDGTLTVVEGVDRPRLSIISPSLTEPHGAIWASDDAALDVAYSVAGKCLARDHHNLEPGDNMLVTVTTGVEGAPASATAYKRFSHFPSEE